LFIASPVFSCMANEMSILFVLWIPLGFSYTSLVKYYACYRFVLLFESEKRTLWKKLFQIMALSFIPVIFRHMRNVFVISFYGYLYRACDQLLRFRRFILFRFFSVNWQWSIAIRVNIYKMYHFNLHSKILRKNNRP